MTRSVFLAVLLALIPVIAFAAKQHPPGTVIVAMVVDVASLEDILASGEDGVLGKLRANGISDDELSDGSVAVGIVYCCGGKISRDTMLAFYVPTDFRVAMGDVVEIVLGRTATKKERKKGDQGTMNRVAQIRDSFESETGACRWDPENETLWMRVLYCDWMPGEGWQYRGGLSNGWFKPLASPE